jgi:hypothetical protein
MKQGGNIVVGAGVYLSGGKTMFEQSLIIDGAGRRNPWSFAASVTVQCVVVAAALALPLMRIAKLETKPPDILFLPRSIGQPEPVPQKASTVPAATTTSVALRPAYRVFQAPARIPAHVATGPDLPDAPVYSTSASGGTGDANGVDIPGFSGLGTRPLALAQPPEAPHHTPQPVAHQPATLRVGEGVQSAKLVGSSGESVGN